MKLFDVITLLEEKGENLLLLDVDATLVIPDNIYIIRKNDDGTETKLTPQEYAKEPVTADKQKRYDFREFREPERVYNSIKTGIPLIPNLKIVDEYIKNGWKIGILTARGMEDVVFHALKDWLQFRDRTGNLQNVGDKLVRDLVHAINDENKHYIGKTDFEKKANVIKKLASNYDRIVFIDDTESNLNAVRLLGLKNVYVKRAY